MTCRIQESINSKLATSTNHLKTHISINSFWFRNPVADVNATPWVVEFRQRPRWLFSPKLISTTVQMRNKDAFYDFLQGKFGDPCSSLLIMTWDFKGKLVEARTGWSLIDWSLVVRLQASIWGNKKPTIFSIWTSRIQELGIESTETSHDYQIVSPEPLDLQHCKFATGKFEKVLPSLKLTKRTCKWTETQKESIIFQPFIFRCKNAVSFREVLFFVVFPDPI